MPKIKENMDLEKYDLLTHPFEETYKIIKAFYESSSKKDSRYRRGDDFLLFMDFCDRNRSLNPYDVLQALLSRRLSLRTVGKLNIGQTNSVQKEYSLGEASPGLLRENRQDPKKDGPPWVRPLFGKEDWLMLFGSLRDPRYPYQMDYKLVFDYRNYRYSWLTESASLKLVQDRLFELEPSQTMRYTDFGGFDAIRNKSPLEHPHRMLPSEFAVSRTLLIEKIVHGKALMYEHLDRQCVLDKTIINIVMDCSQTLDAPGPIRRLSSKVKALGGVILDLLFYYLHAISSARVKVRLILFTPSKADVGEEEALDLTGRPAASLDALFSEQWSIESRGCKLPRCFFNGDDNTPKEMLADFLPRLAPLEGLFFESWDAFIQAARGRKAAPRRKEVDLMKCTRFLPEVLLNFRQLSRENGINGPDFFRQHHSLCTTNERSRQYKQLFEAVFQQDSDDESSESETMSVSPAYQNEFAQLFRKLKIARGEKEDMKAPSYYSSRHVCLITPAGGDETESESFKENIQRWFKETKKGAWDSLYHFEISDSPGLHFRGVDHTHLRRRGAGGVQRPERCLEHFLNLVMEQMILARGKGKAQ